MQIFELSNSKSLPSFRHRKISPCVDCVSRISCLHKNLDLKQLEILTGQYTQKMKIKAGDPIFHNGDPIHSLYTVRVGFVKVEYSLPNGHHQVNHFATNGDLIGADGIANGKHQLDAIAISDGELCCINFNNIQSLMKKDIAIQKAIDYAMSREIISTQEHLFSMGSHTVEQKLAFFILQLVNKLGALHSNLRFIRLPMNREELKSYLGVTTESLSRAFTSLEKKKYFQVKNREISEINFQKMNELLDIT
jgi:CRP/FNR family transcriptional regulator